MAARNELSLKSKVEVIEYAKRNPSQSSRKIAEVFNCGRTQIQGIFKKRDTILSEYEANVPASRKRHRGTEFSDVNEAMYRWYSLARQRNVPVSGPMLQEEARVIAVQWAITSLKHPMAGWRVLRSAITLGNLPSVVKQQMSQRRRWKAGTKECRVLWWAIKLKMSGMKIRLAASTEHFQRRRWVKKRKSARVGKKPRKGLLLHFLPMQLVVKSTQLSLGRLPNRGVSRELLRVLRKQKEFLITPILRPG